MRIQHNITAMNSYRNFSANNSSLSKNLEKLSSGYKINRAGDDAAGLAISEKMRAQITGLEGATKNSKDGISLIQTAEGALTEVHDMLNRMTTLAEQSANGTYQNELDREQLQKEVGQLKEEIDRIADSTNFNGLKLLDGSLSGGGNVKGNVTMSDTLASQATSKTSAFSGGAMTYATNTVAAGTAGDVVTGLKYNNGKDTISFNVSWSEGDEQKTASLTFKLGTNANPPVTGTSASDPASSDINFLEAADGTRYNLGTAGKLTAEELAGALNSEVAKNSALSAAFEKVALDGNGLKLTGKAYGSNSAVVDSIDFRLTTRDTDGNMTGTTSLGATVNANGITAGKDVQQKLSLSNLKVLNGASFASFNEDDKRNAINNNTFEVDGHKFLLFAADSANEVNELKKVAGSDVNIIQLDGRSKAASSSSTGATDLESFSNATVQYSEIKKAATVPELSAASADAGAIPSAVKDAKKDITTIAAELSRVTGRDFSVLEAAESTEKTVTTQLYTSDGIKILGSDGSQLGATESGAYAWSWKETSTTYDVVLNGKSKLSASGKALDLQIGDTADSYNKLSVTVGDMHAEAIGIGDVDISTQEGASAALNKIKQAINNVSDTRGTLGSLQNRLEHTINNLGVQRENIQNAESLIRDTDVAEEMMAYTKNNILNQSAQAMLAQANQLPQGVLQLLG